jgi:hypothetical protein
MNDTQNGAATNDDDDDDANQQRRRQRHRLEARAAERRRRRLLAEAEDLRQSARESYPGDEFYQGEFLFVCFSTHVFHVIINNSDGWNVLRQIISYIAYFFSFVVFYKSYFLYSFIVYIYINHSLRPRYE